MGGKDIMLTNKQKEHILKERIKYGLQSLGETVVDEHPTETPILVEDYGQIGRDIAEELWDRI